jgi:solute carrier family 25 protein 42
LLGIIIYHGCSFFIFTKIKEYIRSVAPESYSKWYVDFAVGAISSLGQFVSYPFEVLRRRMQGQALLLEKGEISQVFNYKTLIHEILEKEGYFKGFYKGVSLNFIKAPLSLATVWTVKNYINRKLD